MKNEELRMKSHKQKLKTLCLILNPSFLILHYYLLFPRHTQLG